MCGEGFQNRTVKCFNKNKGKIELLSDEDCPDEKPENIKKCILRPCEGVDWITSEWSGVSSNNIFIQSFSFYHFIHVDLFVQCKSCGLDQETRTAHCASKSGKIYNETFCGNRKVPELTRKCNQTKCEYMWFTSQWSNCSVDCGKGVQTRNVHCAKFDGDVIKPTKDETKCDVNLKPEATKECNTEKECPGQWFAGPWSKCSKPCGGGEKTRKVLCIANGEPVAATKCNEESILFTKEDCNKSPCVEDDELIDVDTTALPMTTEEDDGEYCDEDDEDLEIIDTTLSDFYSTEYSSSTELSTLDSSESSLATDDLMLSDSTDSTDVSSSTDFICNCVDCFS